MRSHHMPRFFFHLCDGTGLVVDEEGQELPTLEAARARALTEARHIMADDMRGGHLNLASFIEVQNAAGDYLFTLTFEDAFEVNRERTASAADRSIFYAHKKAGREHAPARP